MDQKERDVQTAIGHMQTYYVRIGVPIQATVTVVKPVLAVNEDDAIKQAKNLLKIQPEFVLLDECRNQIKERFYSIKTDYDKNRELTFKLKEPFAFEENAGNNTGNNVKSSCNDDCNQ